MKHIELGRIVSGVIDKLGSYKNESIKCSVPFPEYLEFRS